MANATRDSLRSHILSQKVTSKIVTLEDGFEVEIRQSTVGQMLDNMNLPDVQQRVLSMLIRSCYVPGTEELLFEEADIESLRELPSGGYWQALIDAANSLMLPAQIETAEKN